MSRRPLFPLWAAVFSSALPLAPSPLPTPFSGRVFLALPPQTTRLLGQLLSAVGFLHERGVVHRDVKPENILVDRRGTGCGVGGAAPVLKVRCLGTRLTRDLQRPPSPLPHPPKRLCPWPTSINIIVRNGHLATLFSEGYRQRKMPCAWYALVVCETLLPRSAWNSCATWGRLAGSTR